MTQLDFYTWFVQVVALFVSFFSLYVLVYKYIGPLLFTIINLPEEKIKKHYNFVNFYYFSILAGILGRFVAFNKNFEKLEA